MKIPMRWFVRLVIVAVAAVAVVLAFSSIRKRSILAVRTDMMAASRRYPNFTLQQRMAVLREWQSEMHPMWRDLSPAERARLLIEKAMSTPAPAQAPPVDFLGNLTVININPEDLLGLTREGNCSLTLNDASYNLMLPSFSYTLENKTPNFDQVLHSEAGLTTKGGKFPAGCGDPVLGITARKIVYAGKTKGGFKVYADTFYNGVTGDQDIETVVAKASDDTYVSSANITGLNPVVLAAGDLNGDGNPDLVAVNAEVDVGGSASVSVLLGNADGTFKAPVTYELPGVEGVSAVIEDFNGDGIPDIVTSSSSVSEESELTFLEGKGNGTFKASKSVKLTPPTGILGGNLYAGLIAADLRGNGKRDLVTGAGIVLFGNGNGTFTQSKTLAFTNSMATSGFGPNVVAADFNKDGKMDLAADNGATILIFLGKGDGTFTPGNSYGSINNVGYLTATDLDGDGNIDLYTGVGGPGFFGGDQFEFGQGYALMGNGDGSFQGAPGLPFAFTGLNVADLNGDKIPDGVGLNVNGSDISFTSYLGSANGHFTPKTTLNVSTVKIQDTSYPIYSMGTFGLGDVKGNGVNDLVFAPGGFGGPMGQTGLFVAMGNGGGSFGSPIFIPAPSFVKAGDFDYNEQLSNLWVADVNHDGKADILYNYSDEGYYSHIYYEGIAVQLSNGDGTFQKPKIIQTYSGTISPPNLGPMTIQVGDVNRDGFPDLFVLDYSFANSGEVTKLQLYLGKGNGTFEAPLSPPVANQISLPSFGSAMGQIVLADMNNDGVPDLITLGTTPNGGQAELAISLGRGDGTFYPPSITDFGSGGSLGYGLAAADFNGDGREDVAVTGFNPPIDTGIFLGRGDGTVESFTNSNGTVEPAQAINLLAFGAALAVDFKAGDRPDLVAGSIVFFNPASIATDRKPTKTALSASGKDVLAKEKVTLNAKVTASATPSGTVTFRDNTKSLGTGTLTKDGTATYSTSSLSLGRHSITAEYDGSASLAESTSTATSITVAEYKATVTLTPSATKLKSSSSLSVGIAVAGAKTTPTGTVTLAGGGYTSAVTTLVSGKAKIVIPAGKLKAGADELTATYNGSGTYAAATGTTTVTVTAAATTVGSSE
jgi:hypothetical protein